jgi:hypothetical protein
MKKRTRSWFSAVSASVLVVATQRHTVYAYVNHPDLFTDFLQTASGKTLTQDYVFSNTDATDTTIIFTVFSDFDLPYFGGPHTDIGQYTPPSMSQP